MFPVRSTDRPRCLAGIALAAATSGLLLAATTPLSAQTPQGPIRYAVAARVEDGCFPPCRCPLRLFEDVSGSFDLVHEGADEEGFTTFRLENVDLAIPVPLEEREIAVRGSGIYRLRRDAEPMQSLELDLSLDDAEPERYRSGLVEYTGPGEMLFPRIELSVSLNDRECRDRVFDLRADAVDPPAGDERFRRGDCNGDGLRDLSDAVTALLALFGGADTPACTDACDSNADGAFDIADPIFLLNFLFLGGERPPAPFDTCSTVPEAIGCASYTGC